MRFVRTITLLSAFYAATAFAAPVTLTAEDGAVLKGNLDGSGKRGVVLLHDQLRTSLDWRLFGDKLDKLGYLVIRIDLRGHGESADITQSDPNWPAMSLDVKAAVKALRAKRVESVALVGAGLGANLAVEAAAQDPSLQTTILFSPSLNAQGHKPSSHISSYGDRPLLIVAGQEDRSASAAAKYLISKVGGTKKLIQPKSSARGVDLLDEDPTLEDTVISWLGGNYATAEAMFADDKVQTGDVETNKSTGKRYGED